MMKAFSAYKVLVVCHDIGGAQAILPVVKRLMEDVRFKVEIIAGLFAHNIYKPLNANCVSYDWNDVEVADYVKREMPNILLTATSWKSSLEQRFRNYAKKNNIPSVVVIDFWSNYQIRWNNSSYSFGESQDHVCVMDELTARAFVVEGYPRDKLYVFGHPHLERLSDQKPLLDRKRDTLDILLFSIDLSALGVDPDPLAPILVIGKALGAIGDQMGMEIKLNLRQHPREREIPHLESMVKAQMPKSVNFKITDKTKPLIEEIENCDLVIGQITMALFEARSVGRPAMAVIYSECSPELSDAMDKVGITRVLLDSEKISTALMDVLESKSLVQPSISVYQGATAKIVDLCRSLLL